MMRDMANVNSRIIVCVILLACIGRWQAPHERLCCHAAPFIDNNGIHGWFIAWGHEYFFLSITRIIFLSRIIELSNFVFTRNIADSHGFSFFLFLSRIFEFSNFVFTRNIADSHGFFFFLSRIRELSNFCLPWFSVILSVIEKKYFGTRKIIPWYSAILRVIRTGYWKERLCDFFWFRCQGVKPNDNRLLLWLLA